jgi:hypothetical protein
VFIAIAMVLGIVSMSTLEWLTWKNAADEEHTESYGLVQGRVCHGSTCRTDALDCSKATQKLACEGGKQVIGCAIVSLVCGLAGFISAFFAHRKGKNWMRLLTLFSWFCAGALAILSVILYSKKTVMLDYGYILYLFAAFLNLVGTVLVMYGPGVGTFFFCLPVFHYYGASRGGTGMVRGGCPRGELWQRKKVRTYVGSLCSLLLLICDLFLCDLSPLQSPVSLKRHERQPHHHHTNHPRRPPAAASRAGISSLGAERHLHGACASFCVQLLFFCLALPFIQPALFVSKIDAEWF